MFVNTKFILFYLLFFEFFCSSCERGKIYYHKPIINKVNTGYTNNYERDSNGEQKGNKNNKKGDDDKKGDDEQRRDENDKTENRGDEQEAASTVPLADSSMRILQYVFNTCYFDSALQVLFRCEFVDKKTFSGGDIELEEVYDIFSNYLLNDNCKEAIEKEKLRSLYEKIIEKKSLIYKIGEQNDPSFFFSKLMNENFFYVFSNSEGQEQSMSNVIFNLEGNMKSRQKEIVQQQLEQQKYVIVCYWPEFNELDIKKINKLKGCDEITFSDNNTKFKLIATINHIGGTITSGHYVAYIFDQKNAKWKCYNDLNTIAEIQEDMNFQESGYLYFYKKQE